MRFRNFYNIQYIYYCEIVNKQLLLFSFHFPLRASLKSNLRTTNKMLKADCYVSNQEEYSLPEEKRLPNNVTIYHRC